MRKPYQTLATIIVAPVIVVLGAVTTAQAQNWVNLTNQTSTRMPTGEGQNNSAITTQDPEEKDMAWGDVDHDGDVDLIVVRKFPFTQPGGRRNVLYMNEGGVLIDRASTLANTAINVPTEEGISQGFLDATNDRDVVLADVNNDGWMDIITATTISDSSPRYIGHPRIYMNNGESGGVWQGFTYDYNRIPQMMSSPFGGTPTECNPRFCSLAAGDITGDGYVDLVFGDYDTGEVGPNEPANFDYNNKLLINKGAADPGVFVDETLARLGAMFNYPGVGNRNLAFTTFGAASVIADMNGDGLKDIVKHTSLVPPQHVATIKNHVTNMGVFAGGTSGDYKTQYSQSAYFVSVGDLNGDGKLDMVMTDDNDDRYLLNTGNDANGNPLFGSCPTSCGNTFSFVAGGDDGFGSQSLITDLNNDGWNDVLISDVDVDGFGCNRRLHIYHNLGNPPNVMIQEESPSVIPTGSLQGTHNVAAFDIDNDGWKDLVIGRCNSTAVWMQTTPPSITFTYPLGRPDLIQPDATTTFQVQFTSTGGGTVVAGSAKLSTSIDGAPFVETGLTALGGDLYEAALPATPCGASIRYFISAQLSGGAIVHDPPKNGTFYTALSATDIEAAVHEEFENTAKDWTITSDGSLTGGAWEQADPNGTWNEGVRAAPEDDHTIAGSQAFVTQNGTVAGLLGDADIDDGSTYLVSPLLDLAGRNASVSFAYWFYSSHNGDSLRVEVSNNNGSSWTNVVVLKGPFLGQPNTYLAEANAWKTHSFVVGDYVDPTAEVLVRFTAGDVAPASIVEAGIDDFHVDQVVCDAAPCPADINGDTTVDVLDLLMVIGAWGAAGGPADINGDNVVDVLDLLDIIGGWGPCVVK